MTTIQSSPELTEERVREIAREEAKKVIGEIGETILEMQMGEEEARHLLRESLTSLEGEGVAWQRVSPG